MTAPNQTFGKAIASARKQKAMSQKELASRILKEDGAGAISPQYLNDIEHDRRNPSSDHLIHQFSTVLDIDENLLFVLAGKIPDDLRRTIRDPAKAAEAFMAFRRSVSD
ncbi:helix-turn-helix domain-containing protein [Roseospira visakhapatnamensis]|uniref:Transcriptional regulator with XRE-family HTH domain n=1 Tax=Roseospira visakhapatnamensis TaxID=390880 RepID=A0A7W6RG11_9PROT|nr:helix-turn-helix transcriptional regulator [Roseospira visakhapatnamensis]MBB4267627.1 transcriptional regulator with XRE-family HTH domain [Roseospira visakhapatnamensis]